MPNIKSAIKRVKVTEVKAAKNGVRKSALKTKIKKCKEAITKNDTTVTESFKVAVEAIDKAAAKNLIHKNTAARRKSQLQRALNAASAAK